jgi:UDP-glucose 4-epimerase
MILLTGGAGFIGSHMAKYLSERGFEVLIIDCLYSNDRQNLDKLLNHSNGKIKFKNINICDYSKLSSLRKFEFEYVFHFAALKSIPDSYRRPLHYLENNFYGTLNLIKFIKENKIKNIIYSSTASVYDIASKAPYNENSTLFPMNPYSKSKFFCEKIFEDFVQKENKFSVTCLRYFNPIGCYENEFIGENYNHFNKPDNLMPSILYALQNNFPIKIYGNNYPTRDGTCVRDFIHVMDLVKAHYLAMNFTRENSGFHIFNVGTGVGHSVLELVTKFNKLNDTNIVIQFDKRRTGDVINSFADISKAKDLLNFSCEYNLDDMCIDSYNYYKRRLINA